ncbi:MAG: hypothetical protein A4E45_01119 [Methanosaeta sp. PtaB.Bin039]|nr:MAG: hypothetical protein A4E45_01119 [Methanosaeta sp. PtaB.Bin039]
MGCSQTAPLPFNHMQIGRISFCIIRKEVTIDSMFHIVLWWIYRMPGDRTTGDNLNRMLQPGMIEA